MNRLKAKFNDKLVKPLVGFLKQGVTPKKLALCVALGAVVGLFPVIGVTTVLCLLIALLFKLNLAVIQLINYIVYALQLVLIIPLIRLGSWLVGVNPIPYSITEMLDLINRNFMLAIESLWTATVLGILGWLVTVIPVGIVLYFLLKIVFERINRSSAG